MFLRLVYKHNKLLFVLMVLFIIGQLFVNYKRGVVITPFFNYGMYSEPFHRQIAYPVFEVRQNGQLLRGQDFSPQQWDKILLPLSYYANINRNNKLFETDVKRLLAKININALTENFLVKCDFPAFEKWYKDYLTAITGIRTDSLEVSYHIYRYTNQKLEAADTIIPLR